MPKLKTTQRRGSRSQRRPAPASSSVASPRSRHIPLTSKATKTKRRRSGIVLVSVADTPKVARMLPYA